MVFLPISNDTHQDHLVIFNEGFRAFKNTTILVYEIPWNNLAFTTDIFFVLEKDDIDKKVLALNEYKSQNYKQPGLSEYLGHLSRVRGGQIKLPYAEAFECIRLVVKNREEIL